MQVKGIDARNQVQNANKGTPRAAAEGYALETRGKEETGMGHHSSPDWIGSYP